MFDSITKRETSEEISKSEIRKIKEIIGKLDDWISANGWAGYDPYSAREFSFFTKMNRWPRKLPFRLVRYILFNSVEYFPHFWLAASKCPKRINAKAMGLFAKAYLNLYEVTDTIKYLEKGKECLDWLIQNSNTKYHGYSWGYPFDWDSVVWIPQGTPSSVVTFTVADAFWKAYCLLKDTKYLDICQGACEFFLRDLNQDTIDSDRVCFSYTPLDHMHVYNATLFVSEFLMRVGNEINNSIYVETGRKACNYVISNQEASGAWNYFGPEDKMPDSVDHFHTGFVLRMIYAINEHENTLPLRQAIKKGFDYYIENLFDKDGLPKFTEHNKYPINIHSLSEALMTISVYSKEYHDAFEHIQRILSWTQKKMQHRTGYFYYIKNKFMTVKIPYIRWSQAWMLLSLSEILKYYCSLNSEGKIQL
jgi:hypothetical protein